MIKCNFMQNIQQVFLFFKLLEEISVRIDEENFFYVSIS